MSRNAAFLRAVNLGPHRRVSGARLRAELEGMGFRDVDSFRTSGNVVFAAGDEPPEEAAVRIESGLARSLGHPVVVFVRTAAELRAVAEHEPFAPEAVAASAGRLQVAFLKGAPDPHGRERVLALATGTDRLALGERELYWLPGGGIRDSSLDMQAIERVAGPMTVRTMGTVERLVAKHLSA